MDTVIEASLCLMKADEIYEGSQLFMCLDQFRKVSLVYVNDWIKTATQGSLSSTAWWTALWTPKDPGSCRIAFTLQQ